MSALKHSALGAASFAIAFGVGIFVGGERGKGADTEETQDSKPVGMAGGVSALPQGGAGGGLAKRWRYHSGRSELAQARHALRELPLGELAGVAREIVADYRAGGRARFGELLEVWAERDPEAALRWYESEMPKELGERDRKHLFLGWGRSEAAAAIAYVQENAVGGWREVFLEQVFVGVAQVDTEEAGRLLRAMEKMPQGIVENVLFYTAREDPIAAYELQQSLGRSEVGVFDLDAIGAGARDEDAMDLLAERIGDDMPKFSRDYSPAEQRKVLAMSAAEFLAEFTRSGVHESEAKNLAKTMARFAPSKFIEAVLAADPETLPEHVDAIQTAAGSIPDNLKYELLGELVKRPGLVDEAMAMFSGWHDVKGRARVREIIASLEGQVQADAQLEFTKSLADQDDAGPTAALKYVDTIDDPTARDAALVAVARSWTRREPQRAVEWAVEQSLESGLTDVVQIAAKVWANKDPDKVVEWLETIDAEQAHYPTVAGATAGGLLKHAQRLGSGKSREIELEQLEAVFDSVQSDAARDAMRRSLLEEGGAASVEDLLGEENWSAEETARLQRMFE